MKLLLIPIHCLIGLKAYCACEVWKDVDGVLTCDPNIYSHAKTVPDLTFEEVTELAYFGAQVLFHFEKNQKTTFPPRKIICLGLLKGL
jgi:hypothetical protein